MSKAAIIVLGACGSPRKGPSKQLLRGAVEAACGSGCSPVIVVVAAQDEAIGAVEGLTVEVVHELSGAMGASIQAGLGALTDRDVCGAILTSADQAFVTADYLRGLVTTHFESLKTIVASKCAGTVGIPAYFERTAFPRLMALDAGQGCNEVILGSEADVLLVECPEGAEKPRDQVRIARS